MHKQQRTRGLTVADLVAIDALQLVVHAGQSSLDKAIDIGTSPNSPLPRNGSTRADF